MNWKYIYIFGICGIFMGGVVMIVCELGYKVIGLDINVYLLMSIFLEIYGIEIIFNYDVV